MKILMTSVALGVSLAQAPGAATREQTYGLESRAAIGAHHITEIASRVLDALPR